MIEGVGIYYDESNGPVEDVVTVKLLQESAIKPKAKASYSRTYLNINPLLLRQRLVLVHKNSFCHGV